MGSREEPLDPRRTNRIPLYLPVQSPPALLKENLDALLED
jgi:hypothetical protein